MILHLPFGNGQVPRTNGTQVQPYTRSNIYPPQGVRPDLFQQRATTRTNDDAALEGMMMIMRDAMLCSVLRYQDVTPILTYIYDFDIILLCM
jgi:hypothetical protein